MVVRNNSNNYYYCMMQIMILNVYDNTNILYHYTYIKFLGAEYIGPGRSPLECVVDLYNSVTSYGSPIKDTPPPFPVILLNGKKCSSTKAFADDLVSLVWMLLGRGAEVNVLDIENKTPLHSTLLRSCDLQMAEVLCDNGANISAVDRCGNTPLMSLCSPMPWRTYNEYGPCTSGYDITKAVQYLLRFESVKVNIMVYYFIIIVFMLISLT